MTFSHFIKHGLRVVVGGLATIAAVATPSAMCQEIPVAARIDGLVRDTRGIPVADATVSLQRRLGSEALAAPSIETVRTDLEGVFRFASLSSGTYVLRVTRPDYAAASQSLSLREKEAKHLQFTLLPANTGGPAESLGAASAKPTAAPPDFFDEPQFTVAGVAPATNAGGHGSDTVLRTTEALAKATVSLSKDSVPVSGASTPLASEDSLRKALASEPDNRDVNRQLGKLLVDHGRPSDGVPYLQRASRLNPANAELHHLLGEAEEAAGDPLAAVQEYQRAAELDPSEANLFDWGTELLAHRALEPATEIFTKGIHLYPDSVRMLIALGVSWYARGANDRGEHYLVNASDLAPANPEPYEFLGKIQSVEISSSSPVIERLARFAQLQPNNALANYYYAVALKKQSLESSDSGADSSHVESLLQKAVHLDPKLGAAYLQLGILYSQRADFTHAISAYKNAIEVSSDDEVLQAAHYRLGQSYLRMGEKTKAQQELQLRDEVANKAKGDTDRARRQIQEFVISLQNKPAVSQEP